MTILAALKAKHAMSKVGFLVLIVGVLSACATTDEPQVLPEREYYEQARDAMNSRNFNEAAENLEALETYYPFGRYAEQAQLDLIYARYQSLDLEGARRAADRFLRLNPQSENADYALYVRGVASYNLDVSLASQYFPIDEAGRDPGEQMQAFRDFSRLLELYPGSPYAADARQRMIAIHNRLAENELAAARYYIRRQAYLAAANRAQYVLENFPQAPALEEALIILVETQRLLGLEQAADDALAMLALNFPESDAFNDDMQFVPNAIQPENRSLLSVLTFGLFGNEDRKPQFVDED
jgi:outer membrane protein assembly factor BamD